MLRCYSGTGAFLGRIEKELTIREITLELYFGVAGERCCAIIREIIREREGPLWQRKLES